MENAKNAARVKVCRECLGLRGPCFDTFNRCERVQRCACEPEDPRWNAYDYNRVIELCRCCAAATVSSGSRWSPFFCAECKPRVLAYNDAAGIVVIPIGRHSIMNQISLRAMDAKSVAAVDAFEAGLAKFFVRIERLWNWHNECVRAVVQRIPGKQAAMPLAKYLEHARAGADETSESAFAALVLVMKAPQARGKASTVRNRTRRNSR